MNAVRALRLLLCLLGVAACDNTELRYAQPVSEPGAVSIELLPPPVAGFAYRFQLALSDSAPVDGWFITIADPDMAWLALNPRTGLLSGTPPRPSTAPLKMTVSATASSAKPRLVVVSTVIRPCEDGEALSCRLQSFGVCGEGRTICRNGAPDPNCRGSHWTPDTCGPLCSPCGRGADSCIDGECRCGQQPGCSGEHDVCCSRRGRNPSCVNLSNDVANCGACDVVCGADSNQCAGGRCRCGEGDACRGDANLCCGGRCVDIKNDINNCGGCGVVCQDVNPRCFEGRCTYWG